MAEAELTTLDWLNTVTISLAALEVDPKRSGAGATRPRSGSALSASSYESGYTSSSSDSSDDVAEVIRTEAAAKEAWVRAKRSTSLPALPLEAATAVALNLLKQGSGSTADKVVDFMRKHVPYYAAKPKAKLLESVVATLQGSRHFQATSKGNRTLWTCSKSVGGGRRSKRRPQSGGRRRRSPTAASLPKANKSRSAGKASKPSTPPHAPDVVIVPMDPLEAMLDDSGVGAGADVADALMLSMTEPSDELTPFDDLFGTSGLECTPADYTDIGESVTGVDPSFDRILAAAAAEAEPSQAWLPTIYIPGPTGFDDLLAMC